MKFDPYEDFNQNVSKLLLLLRKMLKHQKIDNKEINEFFGGGEGKKNINLNLCFFTFLPYDMDMINEGEMEELAEEEMKEYFAKKEKYSSEEELKFEINRTDRDFLKLNGIKF